MFNLLILILLCRWVLKGFRTKKLEGCLWNNNVFLLVFNELYFGVGAMQAVLNIPIY